MKGYNAALGNAMASEALTPSPVASHQRKLPLSLTPPPFVVANLLGQQQSLTLLK